jgi:hypothetical protein
MVHVANAVKDDYSNSRNKEKNWELATRPARAKVHFVKTLPQGKRYEPVDLNAMGPNGKTYREDFMACWKENDRRIRELDQQAKAAGELVGRYIDEPVADGKAIYQIVAETDTKVEIVVCTGIGDDWTVQYWGPYATIEKLYAQQKVNSRDKLAEIFAKKKPSDLAAV